MKISVEWLNEKNACVEAVEEFSKQNETDSDKIILEMIRQKKHLEWGNWLIVRVMTRPQYLAYAIFAAEQVLPIFEKKYPDDKRPRLAIDAAKAFLKNDNKKTRDAAWAAAGAAGAAAGAAGAAAGAAGAAAWDAALDAAGAAARAAARAAAGAAAGAAARAAAWAAALDAALDAAQQKMQIKILRHGLKLLEAK